MKKTRKTVFFPLLLCLFSVLVLVGCGEDKTGNTIDEPEITGDYLVEDYSQQLLTDGAETMLGSIQIEEVDETYTIEVAEKKVIPNSGYEEGYYIADTNVTEDLNLGFDVRIACLHDDEYEVETVKQHIKNHSDDSDQLYTVYIMGDSVELIIATEPEDVETE